MSVSVYHADNEPSYTLVETWASQSAHERHVKNLVASGEWDSITAHLSEPPKSGYYMEL